jgi:hypothetical protein
MKSRIQAGCGVVLAAVLAAVSGVAAQDVSQRSAARLSNVDGHVRLSKADANGNMLPFTDQAMANTPLFEGTQLQTGDDGRAELQFDDGTVVRIAPDSTLTLTVLRAGQSELTLNAGMGYFELKGAEKVDFAGAAATASGPATLRVKLDTPPGSVAVFDGAVHLEGNGGTADLHGGQSAQLNAQGGSFNVGDSIEPDSWDAWNSDRDQALQQTGGASPATQGVADNANPAWDDLNDSGNWYNVPDQGYVWSPYEAADSTWDPYGDGNWMWTPGYGYIWISGEPWGYMPYQCGTWNWYSSFGWGWMPGGCTPWWGGGGGVWAINVGGYPVGWRMPIRPIRPHGPRPVHPLPVVPVHRQGPAVDALLPLRDRRTPVQIGNSVVHPVGRTVRPVNDHQLPAQRGMRFGGVPANGGTTVPRPTYRPAPSGSSHARPATGGAHYAPAPRMSAPPPAPRMSAPPAPSRPR